ncbi:MAG: beta-propeller domain-containing protein [Lachnospiraceae bacterium]|nr:beta-propeller domain-containing protein [Lachnospiraceae bacterium]
MNEKDLLQKIKNDSDNLTPPASLQPEAIEKMLREQQAKQADPSSQDTVAGFSAGKKKKRYRTFAKYGSIAAVFALAITALWQSQRIETLTDSADDSSYSSDAEPQQNSTASDEAKTQQKSVASDDAEPQQKSIASDNAGSQKTADGGEAIAREQDAIPEFAEAFTYADNPESIYNTLYKQFHQNSANIFSGYGKTMARGETAEISVEDSASFESAPAMDMGITGSTDFSETNLQEIGVDEGDIVKTDGKYIYILRQDLSLAIVKADGKSSETVSITSLGDSENASIREMYLEGDTLHVIISEYITSLENENDGSVSSPDIQPDIYYTRSSRQAKLLTYDISHRNAPVLTGTVTQEGSYETSRKNGQYIYLFTRYYPDLQDTYDESTIMPRINSTEASASDVFLPDSLTDSTYLVISSVDTAAPDDVLDCKILVSGASNYYVSTENIYIANERYASSQTMTEITKFHYSNGKITGVAAASVKGYLNNSFSMNEHEGKLRVVSTYTGDEFNAVRDFASEITGNYYEESWREHNALYVLDETLQQIGAIEGLADGEIIRSARFFGETGYFVTFRQTDPLFSVDLSDPANPQILGELKVNGFSSYLHFYGENLLLGIGYEADPETGITTGLKLSMFDISDSSTVTEVNRLVLPGITWCPAIEDYKSILVEPEKNLIGFFCDNRYLLFSYDSEKGFVNELTYDFYSDMLIGQAEYNTMRGLYIEDTFYLAGNTFLISFDMDKDFEKTGVLTLE